MKLKETNKSSSILPAPRFLFRYLRDDENLLETLITPYLWFSSPDSLNDPFDLTNVLDGNTSDENLIWYVNKDVGKYLPGGMLKLKEKLQNPDSRKEIADVMQSIVKALHEAYLKRIGLCCFSFVNNSTLMWSHYSGGHSGVCLVIDTKRFVKDYALVKVNYRKVLPKWNLIEARKKWGTTLEYNQKYDQVVLGTKYQEWEYEHEYRLISPNRGKHNMDPESVPGIIFGAKMPMDRRNEIREKIKNLHSNFQFTDAALEVSSGQVVVNGFENSIDNLPIGGWRHLADPEGQFRELNGSVIKAGNEGVHERTLRKPWFYKYKITYAEPSYGTADSDKLDQKLDDEINDELLKKHLLNGRFLHSKHSGKVVSVNEYFQELIDYSYSNVDAEQKKIFRKINVEMELIFSEGPQYYVECSKGKFDIIAMGVKVIFTQFIDYSLKDAYNTC